MKLPAVGIRDGCLYFRLDAAQTACYREHASQREALQRAVARYARLWRADWWQIEADNAAVLAEGEPAPRHLEAI